MQNIIRADLYRIFKSKGVYITSAVFLGLLFLTLFTNGTIGVGTGIMPESLGDLSVTGANAPFIAMEEADLLLYFMLPLVIFIACADFSSGTVKNVLSSGVSRSKYYASKLLLSCVFCVVLITAKVVIATASATLIHGFGGVFGIDYAVSVLKPFLMQLFLLISATCVCVFLVFTTKKTAAVNGIYIAWAFVPILILSMLMDVSENAVELMHYDLTLNIKAFANFTARTSEDISRALIICGFYILASTVMGIVLFNRSEIK